MLSDSWGVPIICILFLDFASFVNALLNDEIADTARASFLSCQSKQQSKNNR